jgi:hypothetical protein
MSIISSVAKLVFYSKEPMINCNVTGVLFRILFSLMPDDLKKIEFDKNVCNLSKLTKI